jgi:hypothetical protein
MTLFFQPIQDFHAGVKPLAQIVVERHLLYNLLSEEPNYLINPVAPNPSRGLGAPVVEPDFDITRHLTLLCSIPLGI